MNTWLPIGISVIFIILAFGIYFIVRKISKLVDGENTATNQNSGNGHSSSHHRKEGGWAWGGAFTTLFKVGVTLGAVLIGIAFWNNHNDKLARDRFAEIQDQREIQSNPGLFWWNVTVLDAENPPRVFKNSPFGEIRPWLKDELTIRIPLMGENLQSGKADMFTWTRGREWGNWVNQADDSTGLWRLISSPVFDGNVVELRGEWTEYGDGPRHHGTIVARRGRQKTEGQQELDQLRQ